jgi:transcriptional regulator with XRE-family HTH domain
MAPEPDHRGTLIRQARERRGWSQSYLATRAACDPGYLSRVERGERVPTDRFMAHLLGVLATGETGAA